MNVKLLVVQGRPAGKVIRFGLGNHFLGRGPECRVRFNSDWVSRQHCQIRVTADQAFLRDLGSRNGTLLDGVLLAGEHSLVQGNQIQIGPVVFEVFLEEGLDGPAGSSTTLLPPDDEESGSGREAQQDSTAQLPGYIEKD